MSRDTQGTTALEDTALHLALQEGSSMTGPVLLNMNWSFLPPPLQDTVPTTPVFFFPSFCMLQITTIMV